MASIAYFEEDGVGNWYHCIQAAGPGESPATNPEKWALVEIPAFFESLLVDMALRFILRGEGAADKALAEARAAAEQIDDLILRHALLAANSPPIVFSR